MQNIDKWSPSLFILKNNKLQVNTSNTALSNASKIPLAVKADIYSTYIPQYIHGELLDLGCGNLPMYSLYSQYANQVTAVDWGNSLHQNVHLDFEMNLNEPLEFQDATFDSLICSDVIEHLEDTNHIFSEIARVLKPNGVALINVPFLYWVHEAPHDHYRITEFAIQRFCQKHKLEILDFQRTAGAIGCFLDILNKVLPRKGVISATVLAFSKLCVWCANNIAIVKRYNDKSKAKFPQAYYFVVQKQA